MDALTKPYSTQCLEIIVHLHFQQGKTAACKETLVEVNAVGEFKRHFQMGRPCDLG